MRENKKEFESNEKMITPLKDFKFEFNGSVYDLKEGVEISMPKIHLKNLKTENVIK